jgi:protein-S-isoprenylcysteine O-methyltransferase Ste14
VDASQIDEADFEEDRVTPESTILALWVAWLASWIAAAFWSNPTKKRGALGADVAFRILFWISATLLLAPFSDLCYAQVQFWRTNPAIRWILVVLTATGFLFVWWSRIHLGRLWSDWLTKKADHHVVDTGPYRFVRHPIYSGLIFSALATAIEKRNFFRGIWSRYSNLVLLRKSATRGTLPAGRARRRRL